jgi:chromosome partitioning protein
MNANHFVHCTSTKGGPGKTALTLNLAGALAARGLRILVVDYDPNGHEGGALRWAAQARDAGRSTSFMVSPALPRQADHFDMILIDHPPGRGARVTDGQVIIPTTLDPGTFFSARRAMETFRKRKPLLVANRVRLDRAEPRMLLAALPGTLVIKDRAIYGSAFGIGATIYDDDAGLRNAMAARVEFELIVEAVIQRAGFPVQVPGVAA